MWSENIGSINLLNKEVIKILLTFIVPGNSLGSSIPFSNYFNIDIESQNTNSYIDLEGIINDNSDNLNMSVFDDSDKESSNEQINSDINNNNLFDIFSEEKTLFIICKNS